MALNEKFARDAAKMEGFLDELAKSHSEQVNAVGQVFQKAAEVDMPTEVSASCNAVSFSLFYFVNSFVIPWRLDNYFRCRIICAVKLPLIYTVIPSSHPVG